MESSQEETKSLPVSGESKTDVEQEGEDLKKIKDLQTLFDKLSKNEQLMLKFNTLKETINFAQIKSIDLIKILRGTQYSTTIEQLFEFDIAFKKLEEGFRKLQCSDPDCELQAIMVFKGKNGEPTIQYCDNHFNHSNNSTKSPKYIELELKLHKILFDEIEIQLVYIQDKIDYIKSDKNQKNMNLYAKIEDEVQRNLDSIKSTLKTTTERIYQIDENYKTKTNNKACMLNFDDFSFVRKDLAECRDNILTILSLISGPSSKNQAAFLIQVMTDFKKERDLEEERKDVLDSSVPHEIYNSDYQLVNFPSQSLQSIKNFEQKISTISEFIETCQKNALELAESFTPFKHTLQQQLDQLLEQNYKECIKQLSLRDLKFYRDNKLKFNRNEFTECSCIYMRLRQFDYGQPNCTTDHIKTCINDNWIYIGEVKEGTGNTSHGIGIRVEWSHGFTIQEGYWKDGSLHGRGREMSWCMHSKYYYIGDYKEGRKNGQGIDYFNDGKCNEYRYEGEWRDDKRHGQGTYYKIKIIMNRIMTKDQKWLLKNNNYETKYTGQWDGSKGIGEINYVDGRKYISEWDDHYRHGLGTLYSVDGKVLNKGRWEKDEYVGKE